MTSTPETSPTESARPPLRRSRDDRVIAGVCAGIADATGLDVTLVRIATVVAAVFTFGGVLVAYVAAYALMTEPDGRPSPVARWQSRRARR